VKLHPNIQAWQTLSREVVFEAKHWFRIMKDTIKLPSGRIVDDYFRIEGGEYVLIYARSKEGKVLVEKHYKHGLGEITVTFPAGFVEQGETPLTAAKRELFEETGFEAKVWKHIGSYVLDGTRNCGKAHYFIAEDLERVTDPVNDDMEELESLFFTLEELLDKISYGELCLLPDISIMAIATNPLFKNLFKVE
jgi:ADP-ribose pyrophosphatase